MRRSGARIIVLAGDVESGKTTLLVSLFERFHEGPFCGYDFAGSRSLLAFEQRCHDSRAASQAEVPETQRTELSTSGFLHVCVRGDDRRRHELLFWDFTGEVYQRARDSLLDAEQLQVVGSANHFALILDGNQLAQPRLRAVAVTHARTLLRSLVEAGVLAYTTPVDLLVTKWDEVVGSDPRDETVIFTEAAVARLLAEFGSQFAHIRVYRVAARPQAADLPFGFGLDDLFAHWLDDGPRPVSRTADAPEPGLILTPFDNFRFERDHG
jgi:hypothetical protein